MKLTIILFEEKKYSKIVSSWLAFTTELTENEENLFQYTIEVARARLDVEIMLSLFHRYNHRRCSSRCRHLS